jgi:hypothetical protein
VITVARLLLAAAAASAAATGAAEEPAATTSVAVEVFTVGLTGSAVATVLYRRDEGPLTGGANPDDRARELGRRAAAGIVLIHSTSWRWESDGRIVLTYLAWAADGALRDGARTLPPLAPPGPTDPLHPRPPEIPELAPLAHGLRHLAFLLTTDATGDVAAALGPRATAVVRALEPTVAGELASPPAAPEQ